jgi:hypothetical protein
LGVVSDPVVVAERPRGAFRFASVQCLAILRRRPESVAPHSEEEQMVVPWPGVHLMEVPSGARASAGGGTSVEACLGMARSGPTFHPRFVGSCPGSKRIFGEPTPGELAHQVRQFFVSDATESQRARIADDGVVAAGVATASRPGVLEDGAEPRRSRRKWRRT